MRTSSLSRSSQAQQVVFAFHIFIVKKATNSNGYGYCRRCHTNAIKQKLANKQHCLYLQSKKTKHSSALVCFFLQLYFSHSLSLLLAVVSLLLCVCVCVAKHLTKPIIYFRRRLIIIGRWQVPTISVFIHFLIVILLLLTQ